MIDVYHYSAQTGEFVSPGVAREDPCVPGTYPLPANATEVAPPEAADGYVRVWDGSAWEQVEDHRGAEGWVNGIAHTVADIGPLPDGWSTETPAPTLAEQIAAIEAEYEVKFAVLRDRMTITLLANGVNEDTNRAALIAAWQTAQDELDAALLALLGGV